VPRRGCRLQPKRAHLLLSLPHPQDIELNGIGIHATRIKYCMEQITMYCTGWCVDCRRAKKFLKDRGVSFVEVNIDEEPDAEDLVMEVNNGRRKVPTIKVGERFFACSPFDPYILSSELNIPLNR
ncbi:MAG TPA: glutaredoxin family protein, partial [Candidatus Angelobacter sp.]